MQQVFICRLQWTQIRCTSGDEVLSKNLVPCITIIIWDKLVPVLEHK